MSSWEATWCNLTNLATLREVARICLPIFPHKSDELSANDDYSQLMITHIKYQKALVWYRIFRFKWCFLKYVCQWISVFDFSVWQTVAYNSTPPSIAVARSLYHWMGVDEKAVGEIESVWRWMRRCMRVYGGNEKGGKDLTFHLFCPEIKMLAGMYEILLRIKITMTSTMMIAWVYQSFLVLIFGTKFLWHRFQNLFLVIFSAPKKTTNSRDRDVILWRVWRWIPVDERCQKVKVGCLCCKVTFPFF